VLRTNCHLWQFVPDCHLDVLACTGGYHPRDVAEWPGCATRTPPSTQHLEMGQLAERIMAKAESIIAGKDDETALALERDDEMDRLHRDIFTMLLDSKWKRGTEAAVDAT
jgi:hypothetical protein